MKKSEMIEHIALVFKLSKGGEVEKVSEEILNVIEELGMLPPQNPNVDNYSIAMGSNANFWEDENGD